MSRPAIVACVLGVVLVVSNAWWAYRALDFGITCTYQQESLDGCTQSHDQVMAILDALVTTPDMGREDIVRLAAKAGSAGEPFEKEGYVWVGQIGLQFTADGRLTDVVSQAC